MRVLHQREIDVELTWPCNRVAAEIAEEVHTCQRIRSSWDRGLIATERGGGVEKRLTGRNRVDEATRLQILDSDLRYDNTLCQVLGRAARSQVGNPQRFPVQLAHRVSFQPVQRPQRSAVAQADNSSDLPTLGHKGEGSR